MPEWAGPLKGAACLHYQLCSSVDACNVTLHTEGKPLAGRIQQPKAPHHRTGGNVWLMEGYCAAGNAVMGTWKSRHWGVLCM